jgi:hypothetical protein
MRSGRCTCSRRSSSRRASGWSARLDAGATGRARRRSSWVYIGACWAEHELFTPAGFVGVFGGPSVGLAGLAILAVMTVLVARSRAPRELRWRRHAAAAQVLLWGSLVLGLPASLGYAWLSGADAFCF